MSLALARSQSFYSGTREWNTNIPCTPLRIRLCLRAHAINRWCICSFVSIIFPIWNPNLITYSHFTNIAYIVCLLGFFFGCLASCPVRIMMHVRLRIVCVYVSPPKLIESEQIPCHALRFSWYFHEMCKLLSAPLIMLFSPFRSFYMRLANLRTILIT